MTKRQSVRIEMIAALASGESITAASKRLGVCRTTIYEWLAADDFKAELDAQTAAYAERITAGMMANADMANAVITDVMLNSEDDATRLRAAQIVLANVPKWREANSLSRQLEEIKELL